MPFERKARAPDVEAAIEAAIAAVAVVREHDTTRRDKIEARAAALRAAIDKGASYDELGERVGLHPTRIRQMAKGK